MIRYTCDLCGRELDPEHDPHYVVQLEVRREIEPCALDEDDDDRDYLLEVHQLLERYDDRADEEIDEVVRHLRYDLCQACCRKFAKNPLGRESSAPLGFSSN